ncbi:phosphopantetheine-binding protein [Hymenobacter sp. 15J16-1T3B]|uniref:phosphopantetheine-binding protein n=1 Tax=Hymenobacter sp. 15J16-1T3B TaxID=2886941 RepID=UPI001D122B77|nr:phosphopantetheine-binding protein [Hymenobacter sp. 15J16-1T3B]MCC3160469.1 phosphopantetheine-binding protein [Hymenobacter sp. 15J16-1T3B]
METSIQWQVERLLRHKQHSAFRLQPDSKLSDDLGLDSIELVELVIDLERRFHIEIPDPRVETLRTVQDVVRCVEDLLLTPAQAA